MKSYDLRRELKVSATIAADGLATEATLSAFKTAFDNEDFATEVTQSDILLQNKRIELLLVSLLEQQLETNKLLKKIYNPE